VDMRSSDLPYRLPQVDATPMRRRSVARDRAAFGAARALAAAVALAFAGVAGAQQTVTQSLLAQPLGLSFGAEERVAYDSNVLEGQPGAELGAWLYTTLLDAGFLQNYGRQHIDFNGTVGRVNYAGNGLSQYDYTTDTLHGNWSADWVGNLHSNVVADQTRQMAQFANFGTAARDVVTLTTASGSLDFPLLSQQWHGLVGGDLQRQRYSFATQAVADTNAHEVLGGFFYSTAKENRIELIVREQHVGYPLGAGSIYQGADYVDRAIDLRGTWTFSPLTSLSGRIGYLRRRVDQLQFEDFSGPAYELTYLWRPTPKSALSLFGARQVGAVGQNAALYAVARTFRVTPSYTPTEKTRINVSYERNWYNNISTPAFAAAYAAQFPQQLAIPGTDFTYDTARLGIDANWAPFRWLEARAGWSRTYRTAASTAFYDYAERIAYVGATARF